jgi:hypothetical protein
VDNLVLKTPWKGGRPLACVRHNWFWQGIDFSLNICIPVCRVFSANVTNRLAALSLAAYRKYLSTNVVIPDGAFEKGKPHVFCVHPHGMTFFLKKM